MNDKEIIELKFYFSLKFCMSNYHDETNGISFRDKKMTKSFRKWLLKNDKKDILEDYEKRVKLKKERENKIAERS